MDARSAAAVDVIVAVLLATAWGALIAFPLVVLARRAQVRGRFAPCSHVHRTSPRAPVGGPVGRVVSALVARRAARLEAAHIPAEVPLVVDLLQVALGSGCTPHQAVEVGQRWGPTRTAAALASALDATRLGLSLGESLALTASRHPALRPLVDVLVVSDRLGAPAGPALARLADETRSDLRRGAEARARTLPVKLLFPLVFLVLPAFGLLTVVPTLLSSLEHL